MYNFQISIPKRLREVGNCKHSDENSKSLFFKRKIFPLKRFTILLCFSVAVKSYYINIQSILEDNETQSVSSALKKS